MQAQHLQDDRLVATFDHGNHAERAEVDHEVVDADHVVLRGRCEQVVPKRHIHVRLRIGKHANVLGLHMQFGDTHGGDMSVLIIGLEI